MNRQPREIDVVTSYHDFLDRSRFLTYLHWANRYVHPTDDFLEQMRGVNVERGSETSAISENIAH
jgi:hypothetical protein